MTVMIWAKVHEKYLTAHKEKMNILRIYPPKSKPNIFFSQVTIIVLSRISLQNFKRKLSFQEIETFPKRNRPNDNPKWHPAEEGML